MNTFSFDNGLQTIFEKREHTGVVAAQIWVKVGSKYEDKKIAGITHFIEHLIFKGTEKLKGNIFATRIESLGGTVNAFTSYDNTVYHIIIPKKAFEEGLDLLIESVLHPAFPIDEIEKERKVILEPSRHVTATMPNTTALTTRREARLDIMYSSLTVPGRLPRGPRVTASRLPA